MIRISIIYAIATILLAAVDAVRIYFARKAGKANIDHHVSTVLAIMWGFACYLDWHEHFPSRLSDLRYFAIFLLMGVSFAAIRFLLYDMALNLFRRLPLNYVSPTTSSWIDRHIGLSFLGKRVVAIIGWLLTLYLYYKIV